MYATAGSDDDLGLVSTKVTLGETSDSYDEKVSSCGDTESGSDDDDGWRGGWL